MAGLGSEKQIFFMARYSTVPLTKLSSAVGVGLVVYLDGVGSASIVVCAGAFWVFLGGGGGVAGDCLVLIFVYSTGVFE